VGSNVKVPIFVHAQFLQAKSDNFRINEIFYKSVCHAITRGPRGPWVAHLRKRSKVTVEPIIENPRGII